jgi:hypothetical protein
MTRLLRLISLLAFFVVLGSCLAGEGPTKTGESERTPRPLVVDFDQQVVVPSTVLQFRLRGTNRLVADWARVHVKGRTGSGVTIDENYALEAKRQGDVGDLYVELPVRQAFWSLVAPGPSQTFEGKFTVELTDAIGILARGEVEDVALVFESQYPPTVLAVPGGNLYVNEVIEVQGTNFLRPEEGTTWAQILSGRVMYGNGRERDISGQRVALRWSGRRNRGLFPLDPAVFGVEIARFEASLYFENELTTGHRFAGNTVPGFDGVIQQSYIAALTPDRGSRGQKIGIYGRGFVASDDEGDYGMLLRYEGVLRPRNPSLPTINLTGNNVLERAPDRVASEALIEQSVWYTIAGRTISGLGAIPGVFEGKITPILVDQHGEQVGLPWEGRFEVLPTKQMVYLKYLPAFSKGLEKYGLENVEREIRNRILEIVHRDYEGINIEFVEEPPSNFIEFATIEIGGPDPSGNNAFGYDNTFNDQPKDTGNLHINDYLGGLNRHSQAEWNNPYGGIFIESFSFFSPTLNPSNQFASPEFDRIMGPFMPALGGSAVLGSEWPGGPRAEAIAEAIRMVGNVVGNTVSHEMGHSMGLTHYPEDWDRPGTTYHNRIPSNCIMDAGADRPFEVRAELPGYKPSRFNERNMDYLRQILPLP